MREVERVQMRRAKRTTWRVANHEGRKVADFEGVVLAALEWMKHSLLWDADGFVRGLVVFTSEAG